MFVATYLAVTFTVNGAAHWGHQPIGSAVLAHTVQSFLDQEKF